MKKPPEPLWSFLQGREEMMEFYSYYWFPSPRPPELSKTRNLVSLLYTSALVTGLIEDHGNGALVITASKVRQLEDKLASVFHQLEDKLVLHRGSIDKHLDGLRADFTELFLTKSSARPSLLFAMKGTTNNEFLFYSLPQIHSQNEKSSLAAYFCSFSVMSLSPKRTSIQRMRYVTLAQESPFSYLGFDLIDKVFKVVSPIAGTLEMRWRKIQCSLSHNASSRAICINGALYYLATGRDHASYIVCFDVQSENFKFIQAEFYNPRAGSLINYKGKIGVVSWPGHNPSGYYWGRNIGVSSLLMHELRIWVLEDVVKGAWSEYAYTLPGYKFWDTGFGVSNVCVVGVTATGEIVLSKEYYNVRFKFYVFYFHPERNTIQRVEIQGFENHDRVYAFVNHLQQHVPRFEKINKFAAPSLLEDE
ncbi:BnaC06g08010D [Brassica napus]|uniref:BnaC06g08010D protein n=1 Tax=Brassica napus TaxID=3708 RepID=A0A078FLK2_BRANA|nr:BnaC06g08010D [Brassica napus]